MYKNTFSFDLKYYNPPEGYKGPCSSEMIAGNQEKRWRNHKSQHKTENAPEKCNKPQSKNNNSSNCQPNGLTLSLSVLPCLRSIWRCAFYHLCGPPKSPGQSCARRRLGHNWHVGRWVCGCCSRGCKACGPQKCGGAITTNKRRPKGNNCAGSGLQMTLPC